MNASDSRLQELYRISETLSGTGQALRSRDIIQGVPSAHESKLIIKHAKAGGAGHPENRFSGDDSPGVARGALKKRPGTRSTATKDRERLIN